MASRTHGWSEQEDFWLALAVAGGLKAAEIAACLPGRSANAVIGRAYRQGFVWKYPPGVRSGHGLGRKLSPETKAKMSRAKRRSKP